MSNAAQNIEKNVNPLEELSTLLHEDMKCVNAEILARMDSPVALIPQVASYLIAAGGKRIRPLLTLAATKIYGANQEQMNRAYRLSAAVEFIHSATLLHDDVVDESEQRRGQDAANLVFGNQATVLVGDFLFSRAFQLMVADGNLNILKILSDASAIIAQGEVMQLSTTGNLETTLEDYEEVIKAKTAALFTAACEVGPVICEQGADQAKALADYGLYLGMAFQIIDDVMDYSSSNVKMGKTAGDDFREGKMTAPVIFALQNASAEEKDFWHRTIENKDQKDGDLAQAIELFEKHEAQQKSITLAKSYGDKAKAALDAVPPGEICDLLNATIDFTIHREF